MTAGKLIIKEHPRQHYRTVFNQETGFFVRKEENGYDEPSWSADGPELIDLSITNYCERGCKFCYRGSNNTSFQHLNMEDVEKVVEQAVDCGTLQMALGGGNPNQHPRFVEILQLIRGKGIVPSYTTNGDGLSDNVLRATANYCGAMAVSVYAPYDESYYESILKRIRSFGIRVNLHAIIRDDTLDMWTEWLSKPPVFMRYVNALVFLNYKPIGQCGEELISKDLKKIERFFKAAYTCTYMKVGFDSCSISGIVKWMDVPKVLVESCEAASFSCFISENMKMYPCSFVILQGGCGDLRKNTLIDIWRNNKYFKKYRENGLSERCVGCWHAEVCKGGCKVFKEINFCGKE